MLGSITGQAACLAAAGLWAVAVMVFRGPIAAHGATTINLAKCLVATALLAITVLLRGGWQELVRAPEGDLILLSLSGMLGLVVGDTALFAAVSRLGVHRTLLLQTAAPVFAAALALPLGETLGAAQGVGGILVLVGVALVVAPPGGGRTDPGSQRLSRAGLLLALVAALGQGSGVVVAKQGMGIVPVLPATLVRLAAASAGLALVALVRAELPRLAAVLRNRAAVGRVLPASVLGTYLAMLLAMAGISLAPASIAAVLLATTPVFSLVLELVVDRRRPGAAGVIGTLLAVGGVAVLSAGG